MKNTLLSFNKIPSYKTLKNIISECQCTFNDKQLLNRYGKLLLAIDLYLKVKLPYPHKDFYLYKNMRYAEAIYKNRLCERRLLEKYTFFIESTAASKD